MRTRSEGGVTGVTGVAVAATVLALVAAGCGDSGSGAAGGAGAVVGAVGVAPGIAPEVAAAAHEAGCEVASHPAAQGTLAADGAATEQPVPPVQGPHNERWADWGVYDASIPEPYVIHNMSHGGIVVRMGRELHPDARRSLVETWAADPDLVLVEPGGPGVPVDGFVVTAWLRDMRCPAATAAGAAAVAAFRDAFRGHGLHPQAGNYDGPDAAPPDLPSPVRTGPGA